MNPRCTRALLFALCSSASSPWSPGRCAAAAAPRSACSKGSRCARSGRPPGAVEAARRPSRGVAARGRQRRELAAENDRLRARGARAAARPPARGGAGAEVVAPLGGASTISAPARRAPRRRRRLRRPLGAAAHAGRASPAPGAARANLPVVTERGAGRPGALDRRRLRQGAADHRPLRQPGGRCSSGRAARASCAAPPTAALELDFVPRQVEVEVGDRVLTAGIDGVFPPGLPIGIGGRGPARAASSSTASWSTRRSTSARLDQVCCSTSTAPPRAVVEAAGMRVLKLPRRARPGGRRSTSPGLVLMPGFSPGGRSLPGGGGALRARRPPGGAARSAARRRAWSPTRLAGGPFGLHGFADTLVGYTAARVAQQLVVQRSSGVVLVFTLASALQQALLAALAVLLLPTAELPAAPWMVAKAATPGPSALRRLLLAQGERLVLGRVAARRVERRRASGDEGERGQVREERETLVRRVKLLSRVTSVLLLGLGASFWFVQVVQGSYYRELAENNRLRKLTLKAPRGTIYDRNGRVLVENAAELQPHPRPLPRPRSRGEPRLRRRRPRPTAGGSRDACSTATAASPRFQPVLLAEGLTLDQVARLEVGPARAPGVRGRRRPSPPLPARHPGGAPARLPRRGRPRTSLPEPATA